MRRFLLVLATLVAAASFVSAASAAPLWYSEHTMIEYNYLRYSFIYDVHAGHTISDSQFVSPAVSAFYKRHGFDANFLYWAPTRAINPPNQYWTYCTNNGGGLCSDANVRQGDRLISSEFAVGPIHVRLWNGAFIGTACGNYNHGGHGPVPTIRGVKYNDLNGDGVREAGEPGIAGWTIDLYYNNRLVASTTTGSDGTYAFALNADHLPIGAGTYKVVEVPRSGWVQSQHPAPIGVGYGIGAHTYGGLNFGNYELASISGRKFEDMNADGSGSGDPGLPNWTINYTGRSSGSTLTGPDGSYRIAGLRPGTYTVSESQQQGWTQSLPGGSGSYTVTVHSGDTITGIDFGNWRPATIQGRKFDDHGVDGSGTGDPGLPGWTITLSNGATTTTADDGSFSFTGLKPGSYTVGEQQQTGWRQTAPPSSTETVTLTSGQVLGGVDFGNVCLGSIAVQVPDGVTVEVDQVNVPGVLANDPALPRYASGTSTIAGLLPGVYRVILTLPDGVYTTDPDLTAINGSFAIVKTVTVAECQTTTITPPPPPPEGGKITGGIRILVPGGYATGGFEFMQQGNTPRGTLEYNDHASGLRIHTTNISEIYVSGTDAWVFGHASIGSQNVRFQLHLVDAGEPGTNDHFELLLSNGYTAGKSETLDGGNIQIHQS